MKKHEITPYGDICIHCGGTSSSPIECIDRPVYQLDEVIHPQRRNYASRVGLPTARTNGHQSHCGCEVCRMLRNY